MGFDLIGKRGIDFRNNVWWWRPLATFILQHCHGLGTTKDQENWHYNSGYFVTESKAELIANQLEEFVKSGVVHNHAILIQKQIHKAEKHNAAIEILLQDLLKKVKKETGKQSIAPIDYPEPYRTEWDRLFESKDSAASYPFSVDNVNDFIDFCRKSGGFEIY